MTAYALNLEILKQAFNKYGWNEPGYYWNFADARARAHAVANDIAEDHSSATKAYYSADGAAVIYLNEIAARLSIHPIQVHEGAQR